MPRWVERLWWFVLGACAGTVLLALVVRLLGGG